MSKTARWLLTGAVIALMCVGIITFALRRPASPPGADTADTAPSIPLKTVAIGTFVERVNAQGRVGPPAGSSAKIAFAQAGIVRAVNVHVGATVHAGDVVAELDRSALDAAVRSAAADVQATGASGSAPATSVTSAEAKLAVAIGKLATLEQGGPSALNGRITAQSAARQAALKVEADSSAVTRSEQLLAAGVIAGKDLDAARAQLQSDEADARAADARVAAAGTDFRSSVQQARADVASARSDVQLARGQTAAAQARLQSARIAFANGVLTSPSDGIVLAVLKHPGEAVDPSAPVAEIGPALSHAVTLTVPGDVARRIATGDAVQLNAPAYGETTHGSVLAVVPTVDPTTQSATVVVGGAPAAAVAGDAVTATIVVAEQRGIVVPTSAIVQDPQSGDTVVFVYNARAKSGDSPFALRKVRVRSGDSATSLIESGLHAGERIAAQGGYMLLAPAGGG